VVINHAVNVISDLAHRMQMDATTRFQFHLRHRQLCFYPAAEDLPTLLPATQKKRTGKANPLKTSQTKPGSFTLRLRFF